MKRGRKNDEFQSKGSRGNEENRNEDEDSVRRRNADEQSWNLHNSDQLRMALVASLFIGDNYLVWSIDVKTTFEAKDKLGFIDGTFLQPTDVVKFQKWKKTYSMLKSWVTNSIAKHMTDTLMRCRSLQEEEDTLGLSSEFQLCNNQVFRVEDLGAESVFIFA
ncbi:putative retroelement pol polyprotein [Senna tora]|uniref:Putative retroelement pol polyprotein n=1 Tax=Senna tora TaxID=362788 RepID=A0A834TQR4_9FABA|nr:putative retroelement pol polyprotein [Senna tora]